MPPPVRTLPPDVRRILVVSNPKAGARNRRDLVEKLQRALEQRGFEPELIADGESLRQRTDDQWRQVRAVVAAGGDGTIAFVANRTPREIPLAVLPLGTENLLAKYLEHPADPLELASILAEGGLAQLDAGQAGERIFLLMAGIGFDAEVVRRLHAVRRGNINRLSYFKPILSAIRNYQYPQVRLYCLDAEGREVTRTARWVFVMNVPRYALGLTICPEAIDGDGLLNVCMFERGSFWTGVKYLFDVLLGRHRTLPDYEMLPARELRLESDECVPFQVDGDPGGQLPLEIKVLPQRLTFVVSQEWLARRAAKQTE